MAKAKSNISEIKLPKLFRRGRKGYFYFRKFVQGKDTWICTWETEPDKAKEEAERKIKGKVEIGLKVQRQKKVAAYRLADAFVKDAVNDDNDQDDRVRIDELHDKFVQMTPGYSDLSDSSKEFNKKSVMRKFIYGCQKIKYLADDKNEHLRELSDDDIDSDEKIVEEIKKVVVFADEVDHTMASTYATKLWSMKLTARTYNGHLKFLSRVFSTTDVENANPFDFRKLKRAKANTSAVISHEPLEPEQLKKVIAASAGYGEDFRDLFVIGFQTGLRLKDAVKLQWNSIRKDGFIEVVPFKTVKSGNKARVPISKILNELLDRRRNSRVNEYVLPELAKRYDDDKVHCIDRNCKAIFNEALGEENTILMQGRRKRSASIYSFHSFRSTMMSLLAQRNVSTRDAMRILGWESPEMIRIYEHELEKARGQADERTKKLIEEITELQIKIPEVFDKPKKFHPEKQVLEKLVGKYSNLIIARIYGISNVAIKKWMDKFGIHRARRIESADVSDEEIARIRKSLQVKSE